MADVLCAVCAISGPPAIQIGAVVVCSACGTSLVAEGSATRRATASDLPTDLSDLQQLQRARASIVRRR